MGLKELQWTPVQTEIIELDSEKLLFVELLSTIRKGEDTLGIDHANLDSMNGEELAAYLTELRCKYKQRADGEESEDSSKGTEESKNIMLDIPDDAKTIDDLTEAERKKLQEKGFDLSNIDYVRETPYATIVSSGMRRYLKARLGKKTVSDAEMPKRPRSEALLRAQLKADYNAVLAQMRVVESRMTSEGLTDANKQEHQVLLQKLSGIYDAILFGGYVLTPEETRQGFNLDKEAIL